MDDVPLLCLVLEAAVEEGFSSSQLGGSVSMETLALWARGETCILRPRNCLCRREPWKLVLSFSSSSSSEGGVVEGELEGGVRLVRNASRALNSGGTELSLLGPWLLIVLAGRGSLIWCLVTGGTRGSSVAGAAVASMPVS